MKKRNTLALAGMVAVLGAAPAHALVLDPGASAAQKELYGIRADISKQLAGFTQCIVKANLACEATGATTAQECFLSTSTANAPADAKGKFAEAVAKCDAKVDYLKKNKSFTPLGAYQGLGCPGDSDGNTPGAQPFNNMDDYEAAARASAKAQVQLLGSLLQALLPSCTDQKCVASASSALASYTSALQSCLAACENDFKNKKGNGGPDDLTTHCEINPGDGLGGSPNSDPNFDACIQKAAAKATKNGPLALQGLVSTVAGIVGGASNSLYNLPSNCN